MLIFSMMEDDEVFLPNSDSDEVVSVAPSSSNIRNDEIASPTSKISQYLGELEADEVNSNVEDINPILSWKSAREFTTSREMFSDLEVETDSESLQSNLCDNPCENRDDDSEVNIIIPQVSSISIEDGSVENETSQRSINIDELSDFDNNDARSTVVIDDLSDFPELEFDTHIVDGFSDIEDTDNKEDCIQLSDTRDPDSDKEVVNKVAELGYERNEEDIAGECSVKPKKFKKDQLFDQLVGESSTGFFNVADYVLNMLENPENEEDAIDLAEISSQEDDKGDLDAALEELEFISTPRVAYDVVFSDPAFAAFNEFLHQRRGFKLTSVIKEFISLGNIPIYLAQLKKHELEIELSEYVVRNQKSWRYKQLEQCYSSLDKKLHTEELKTPVDTHTFLDPLPNNEIIGSNTMTDQLIEVSSEVPAFVDDFEKNANPVAIVDNDLVPPGRNDDEIIVIEVKKAPGCANIISSQDDVNHNEYMRFSNSRKRLSSPLAYKEHSPKQLCGSPSKANRRSFNSNQPEKSLRQLSIDKFGSPIKICCEPTQPVEVITLD